ncbi:MAG: phosphoenolpyruvate-utilizing N-terminal domain-containing protein [Lawsonibacter sp.]|nr:phosphoenolpyruvate-utilizing N-terminal domain-containing protein [Lawsonibacter sp.]
MEMAIGKSILDQIVFGRLRFFQRQIPEVAEFSQLSWEEEKTRFQDAQHQAVLQLAALYDRTSRQVGEGMAAIFAIHAMLLEDEDFVESIQTLIREKGATAEYAVRVVGREFGAAFATMDSPYMRARAVDIQDISRRVMRLLLKNYPQDPLREGSAILVADEFLPSEVIDLDHRRLLGLIARKGSVDSHTSMLLRAYGIPAMAEVELDQEWDGHLALLDGFDHRLYLDPDRELVEMLRLRYQAGKTPSET